MEFKSHNHLTASVYAATQKNLFDTLAKSVPQPKFFKSDYAKLGNAKIRWRRLFNSKHKKSDPMKEVWEAYKGNHILGGVILYIDDKGKNSWYVFPRDSYEVMTYAPVLWTNKRVDAKKLLIKYHEKMLLENNWDVIPSMIGILNAVNFN